MPLTTKTYYVSAPHGENGYIKAGIERIPVMVWKEDLQEMVKGYAVAYYENEDSLDFYYIEYEGSYPSNWVLPGDIDFVSNEQVSECELNGYCPADLSEVY